MTILDGEHRTRAPGEGSNFVVGDSELARRIRAHPWHETELGPLETWPESLRTLVTVMLSANQQMYTVWGPGRILLYNDRYIEVLQGHHPDALGRDFLEVWREIADDLTPLVESAYAGIPSYDNDITLFLERDGQTVETHFAYSYTPVLNANGAVDGFFCACIETTEQVNAARTIRDKQQHTAILDQIGTDLARLTDPDAIMGAVGARIGEHLGVSGCGFVDVDEAANEVTAHHAWNAEGVPSIKQTFRLDDYLTVDFVRAGRAGENFVIRDAATDPRTDAAAFARLKIGAVVTVPFFFGGHWIAYLTTTNEAPRDWRADEIALLEEVAERVFTRIERARAEAALRASEDKYRTLFESIDEGFCVLEILYDEAGEAKDCRYVQVNPAFLQQTGQADPTGMLGSAYVPDSAPTWLATYDAIVRSGEPVRFEQFHPDSGRWYSVYASIIGERGSRLVASVFDDITERKRAEAALRESEERRGFLLELSDALRPLTDPFAIQHTAMKLLAERLDVMRAGYLDAQPDQDTMIMAAYFDRGAPSTPESVRLSDYGPARAAGFRAGITQVLDDAFAESEPEEQRNAHRAIDVGAWIIAPLIKQGRLSAIVGVVNETPRTWTPMEVDLVNDIAERTWDAAERARAEAALRESENRHSAIYAQAAAGFAETATDGRFIRVNPEYCRIVGRSREELLGGLTMQAITHPDDQPSNHDQFIDAVRGGAPFEVRKRYIRPDGSEVWVHNSVAAIRGADGRIASLHATSTDVSRAMQAEIALRESEARQRLMVELVPVLLWSASPDGQEVNLNERWMAFTGQSEAETQHYGWLDAIHPDDLPGAKAVFEHDFATGEPLEREQRIRKAGDGYRWHLIRHVPVRNEQGSIVRWFGAAVDIHDSVLAEQALRDSEERLALAVDIGAIGHWSYDIASGALTTSAICRRNFGRPEHREFGYGELIASIHPDDRQAQADAVAAAVDRHVPIQIEYRLFTPAGAERWVAIQGQFVDGDRPRLVGVSQDITARKTAETALSESRERLQVLVAELEHRVRNILTVVRSVFGRTVEAGGDAEDIANHFKGRLDALARTQVVVTQSARGDVDLENLIRDELLSVGVAADGDDVVLTGPDIALPGTAAESIGLAIHELTTNAIKYGALRGPGGKLRIEWTANLVYGGRRELVLKWTEQGVPAIALKPARRGFGSELIEEALPYRLGAETKLEFRGGGVRCTIAVPLPDPGAIAADA